MATFISYSSWRESGCGGHWVLGPRECPLWPWKFFRGHLPCVEEAVQLFGLQRTECNQRSQAVHCEVTHRGNCSCRGGVAVASLEPRHTRVTCLPGRMGSAARGASQRLSGARKRPQPPEHTAPGPRVLLLLLLLSQ